MLNNYTEAIIKSLDNKKEDIKNQWQFPKGTKTKHFIIDNLIDDSLLFDIYKEAIKHEDEFIKQKSLKSKKSNANNLDLFSDSLKKLVFAFQDQKVIKKISDILDLTNLEPDPYLYAAGISAMRKGDFLNPHLDNSHDVKRERYRRLNLLYYITPEWSLTNGGNFELWDNKISEPLVIHSKFNRLLVMNTDTSSYHSVNKVLVNKTRFCVSNYYYSKDSPSGKSYKHVTSFYGRPKQNILNIISPFDNFVRNLSLKLFNFGRGKKQLYKKDK